MRIINEVKLDFDDVLIRPKRSKLTSRQEVDLERTWPSLHGSYFWMGTPILAANMDSTGTIAMAKAFHPYKMGVCLHKFYPEETLVDFFASDESIYSFYTLGISKEDIAKLHRVHSKLQERGLGIRQICVDVANGYSTNFEKIIVQIRKHFDAFLMVGNVVTPEMTQQLLLCGADAVKIGIGPGSACSTRSTTGVGYPQLSAIIECTDAAHGAGGLICADGGCKTPGDVCKAFGAGADFVMLGGMFAGHDECEGEWEEVPEIVWATTINKGSAPVASGKKVKKTLKFYGMSSTEAMQKYSGGVAEYRASEGKCMQVPYKGPVKDTVQQILGGLRSACTYVGASKLKDLSKCTTFVRLR